MAFIFFVLHIMHNKLERWHNQADDLITKVFSNWLLCWPGNCSFRAWKIENRLLCNTVQYLKSVVDSSGAESVLWYKIFELTIAMSRKSKTLVIKRKTYYYVTFIWSQKFTQIINWLYSWTTLGYETFTFSLDSSTHQLLGSPWIEVIC